MCSSDLLVGDHRRLFSHMSIAHPATFVARRMYERYGLFDPSCRVSGDWEFILRLFRAGERFCAIDRVLTAFRNSGISSAYTPRLLAENRRIYKSILPRCPAWRAILKMHLKHWGRGLVNALGLAEAYARYRDGRLLNAERTGVLKSGEAKVQYIDGTLLYSSCR